MRALILSLILAGGASAAGAQDYLGLGLTHDAERIAAEAAARQRDITLTNEISTLQARLQSEQALSDVAASRVRAAVPTVTFNPNAPAPVIDARKLAAIPDATLADSDAKVRAAAANRK